MEKLEARIEVLQEALAALRDVRDPRLAYDEGNGTMRPVIQNATPPTPKAPRSHKRKAAEPKDVELGL